MKNSARLRTALSALGSVVVLTGILVACSSSPRVGEDDIDLSIESVEMSGDSEFSVYWRNNGRAVGVVYISATAPQGHSITATGCESTAPDAVVCQAAPGMGHASSQPLYMNVDSDADEIVLRVYTEDGEDVGLANNDSTVGL
jgi:hypothetical protein